MTVWDDLLFPGDQRDLTRTFDGDDAIVHFARQQSKRKAHHPAGMTAHALDGQMRLAGIGGTQHGCDGRSGKWGHDPLYVGDERGEGKGKVAILLGSDAASVIQRLKATFRRVNKVKKSVFI